MLLNDFKYGLYLTALFSSGTVSAISTLMGGDNHLSDIIYCISLILILFNYLEIKRGNYLWEHTFHIVGFLSMIELIFICTGFKSIILNNIIAVIYLIVWIISVNHLSNHHRNKPDEEIKEN